MKKIWNAYSDNKLFQGVFLLIFIAVTSLSLYLAQKSVTAFLLLLSSLLLLYFTKFNNLTKWLIAGFVLIVLLPFTASHGDAYQSYMEVSTLVGIYIAMALGLNIVVGMAGLLDLGFVAFFAVGAYTYGIFATAQASNFMPF